MQKSLGSASSPHRRLRSLLICRWWGRRRARVHSKLAPQAFHGPLGESVERLEPFTEADPAAILVQILVAFGNMIGRFAHFYSEGLIWITMFSSVT